MQETISAIKTGGMQGFAEMTVVPISMPGNPKNVSYIMLSEALSSGRLVIQEVSTGGSVPELSVTNKGEIAVLIIDGEELAGAKQNRVANTSILVPREKPSSSRSVVPNLDGGVIPLIILPTPIL